MPNEDLTELMRTGASIAAVEVDVSTSSLQPAAQAEGRRREVTSALTAAGVSEDDVAALLATVVEVPGAADPIGVAALAAGGAVVRQETPGSVPTQTRVEVTIAPDLTALLRARERALVVLAVEARAAGGVLQVFPAAGVAPEDSETVTADDTDVHDAHAGGISQAAHPGSAEDSLAHNARQLADRARHRAETSRAAAVLLTGDPRSAELVARELGQLEGAREAILAKDVDAAGADPADLPAAVVAVTDRIVASAQRSIVDDLSADSFRLGAVGVDAVVAALQGAAVDTLLVAVDDDAVPSGDPEPELVVLGAAPWVAASESDALDAPVLGRAPVRAALLRAAVLTSAAVRFPASGVLPDGAPVAAHLRYPVES